MRLSFIYPAALVLLVLLPLLLAFTFATRRAQSLRASWRFWALIVLRSVALLALVLALAGTQLVRPVDDLTVVFLIDGSDSVAPAQKERAVAIVNEALKDKRPDDQAAVVLFGENALVERAPSTLNELGRLTSTPIGVRTDIAEAIQLGLALLPADRQKRLVLLSDGGENSGRAVEAARIAAVRGVPLDVVPLLSQVGADVLVTGLDAPDAARAGQEVKLLAAFRSTIDTTGQLQVFADGELIATQDVTIPSGNSSVAITVPGEESGFHRYEVRLEAQGDTQPVNNRAAAFTTIQGPPRVLLVASDPSRATPLQNALKAASVDAMILPPGDVPAEPTQLGQYAGVILVDVLARDVPRAVQEALPTYVRDLGRGLAMVGGSESFGAGGWRRSPLADVLPVELDPLDTQQQPNLGLVMVIDRSGSMSDAAGGVTKLDLAKEAVYQASLGLARNDQIGVVAFDDGASWAMNVQQLPDAVQIEQALGTIGLGGGTNIRSGIEPAAQALAGIDAKVKHVILLTDGLADSNYSDLISQMRQNNTTISVVAIGSDANPALQQIAESGGGRYYRVQNLDEVPRIFLSETVLVAGRDIVDRQFTPVIALPSAAVRGLDGFPSLYGYNATEQRPAARTILVTPDGKPILAQWQYGLGRSVAWTSDFKGQWARDWLNWDQFPRFINGFLDALLPPPQVQGLTLEARTEPGTTKAIIELNALDDANRPLDQLNLTGRILDPAQQGSELRFTQIAPGRYRAEVPAGTPGVYLAQVAAQDKDGNPVGSASNGLVVSYSPEYSAQRDNTALLSDLANITDGRDQPVAAKLFDPVAQPVGLIQEIALPLLWLALILWPLDIALRRLLVRRSDLTALMRRLRPRRAAQPVAADPTMARLRAAKAGALERRQQATADQPRVTSVPTATVNTPQPVVREQPVVVNIQPPEKVSPPVSAPQSPISTAPTAISQPEAEESPEESMARLLAAKRRARRR